MKKLLSMVLCLAMAIGCFAFVSCGNKDNGNDSGEYKIAMVTDYGDITDQSFNQSTWEAVKKFGTEKGMQYKYYKPTGDSTQARVTSINDAIEEGYNVIVTPGYAFAGALVETAEKNPDVKFIAIDVGSGDFEGAKAGYKLPSNLTSFIYQEELPGYMAGYAAVKEGYTKLGFLGGMAVPAVVRYGYGFVQGANDAAKELNISNEVTIEYVYGNKFGPDPKIKAYMDTMYQSVDVVFACGGGIYISACEAAKDKGDGKKLIGVDVDQSFIINKGYGEGRCITSAMKGLAATTLTALTDTVDGNFSKYAGKISTLGIIDGNNPENNYVQLPMDTWTMTKFTVNDYKALVKDLFDGKKTVSGDTENHPEVSITVNYATSTIV